MFTLGKMLKYTIWGSFVLFFVHLYLVKKTANPSSYFFCNSFFLDLARSTNYLVTDLITLLTRPPVEKLLGDRPDIPGIVFPKVLVLNLRGTLIHSEYKFGIGFEILKRPGLSVFINRMSKFYEIVVFGDSESM